MIQQSHSPRHIPCCCCCQVTSVVSDSVRPHRRRLTRLPRPWDSPGKNTGVGCHFLLQCMKVKVKSLSRVPPSATPRTAAFQAAPSMGFSRQEYWSGVPYPEEIIIERDTYIPLFIAALFIVAKTGKQPRCPSTDEQIKKLWYIYTMEYYSAIKRNTFESVLMRWINLEPITQCGMSQKEKGKYHILMHIYRIQKNGTEEFIYRAAMEKQTQRIDLWTWGEGRRG